MIAQENSNEELKASEQSIPELPELPTSINPATVPTEHQQTTNPNDLDTDNLPPLSTATMQILKQEAQLTLRRRMKSMTPMERELEERIVQTEAQTSLATAEEVNRIRGKMTDERRKRRDEGKGTATDTIAGWLGW